MKKLLGVCVGGLMVVGLMQATVFDRLKKGVGKTAQKIAEQLGTGVENKTLKTLAVGFKKDAGAEVKAYMLVGADTTVVLDNVKKITSFIEIVPLNVTSFKESVAIENAQGLTIKFSGAGRFEVKSEGGVKRGILLPEPVIVKNISRRTSLLITADKRKEVYLVKPGQSIEMPYDAHKMITAVTALDILQTSVKDASAVIVDKEGSQIVVYPCVMTMNNGQEACEVIAR